MINSPPSSCMNTSPAGRGNMPETSWKVFPACWNATAIPGTTAWKTLPLSAAWRTAACTSLRQFPPQQKDKAPGCQFPGRNPAEGGWPGKGKRRRTPPGRDRALLLQPAFPYRTDAERSGCWEAESKTAGTGNYLLDGRCEISNNRAERQAKSYGTGRKNFLFHDTVSGAKSSAIIYSLVETAKANGLNVLYLYTLLLYMPDYKDEPAGVEAMMPWSDFIKERCQGTMDVETETPENKAQIPVWPDTVFYNNAILQRWVTVGYSSLTEHAIDFCM